ncbi:glutaredoxin family protein [Streptomyces sp. AC495_CC817]|uniref:glutaredoxin family protein n=1 Tax=Streptomyces sp. AC495_CC817 TaxID=2823900 RepID=UPI001C26BF21|nr:glutaredoxin family protein [Streptomyces sp. AC495_CC817]
MSNRITIYSVPGCAPCLVAKKRLDAEGIPYEDIDLSENPETLDRLKRQFGVPKIQTPLIHYAGEYHTIAGLTNIIAKYKETN